MKKYIGVKIIAAVVIGVNEAFSKGYKTGGAEEGSTGYEITYPDGYKSWCPKDVFEESYFPLDDPDGSRIMPTDAERMMGNLTGEQISPKSTLVKAENSLIGFDTYNVSSCVDPANYDTETGIKYGLEPIKTEFWQCLGFVLQWAKNGLVRKEIPHSRYAAHQQRVISERNELVDKIVKLEAFLSGNAEEVAGKDEVIRLEKQLTFMSAYRDILDSRIAGF